MLRKNAIVLEMGVAVLFLATLYLILVVACDRSQVSIERTAAPTTTGTATQTPIPPPPPTVTPTPALTTLAGTAAFEVPPADLCREYLHLSVLQGTAEGEAVASSYQCHGATIDSTGQSPSRSPDLVIRRGAPVQLQLAVAQRPTAIDVRLYPGAGLSASFLRWPEELPTHTEAVDGFQPEPDTHFQYLPQALPGPHSLVVKVTWGEGIAVFYAISLTLEDAAK